jgi:hypothetical protein
MALSVKSGIVLLGGTLLLVLFVIYVWPTRWKYAYTNLYGRRILVRIDRLHPSRVEEVTVNGWRRLQPTRATGDQSNTMTPEQFMKEFERRRALPR